MSKIAINTRFLLKNNQEGLTRFTHEICMRLVKNNPDVEFHFLFDRPYDESFIYGPNVIPHVIYPPARHPYLWYYWFEWRIPKILKKIQVDCFFSPDNFLSLSTSVPTLMVTHDIAYKHYPEHIQSAHLRFFKKYMPLYHHRAEKVACVSAFTRSDVINKYNLEKEKTCVVHNGCSNNIGPLSQDEKEQIRNVISNGQEYFISIGAIHPRKNIEKLIHAFELFKAKSISQTKLLIVGRTAWKSDNVIMAIKTSRCKKDIIHLENEKDIRPLLGAAKCLCYLSLFEGFGIPILEAFHTDIPVITSNVSSMPEVAGDSAILIDPNDVNKITDALVRIDTDQSLRRELIKKGRKQKLKFSWDKSAEKVMTQLRSLY